LIGETISHYRVIAKLGEGGMGEVYRATDTKLGREVAIKIIPETFAQDAGRMARFAREAHLTDLAVLSWDVTGSDASQDSAGIASYTVEWQPPIA
jgi:serine/threonine protein kinase